MSLTTTPATEPRQPPTGLARVLIADDTPEVRRLLAITLGRSGLFEVVGEAGDGQEAVDLAVSLRPDVVLLDLAMPVLDGLEALPLLRAQVPTARVVVLSGFNADRMADRAMEAGAVAYIEKCHRPNELVRLIAAATLPAASRRVAPVPPPTIEETARDARERFRIAFEAAPIGMAIIDLDGHFVEVNPESLRIAGLSEGGFLGCSVEDITHPDDWQVERGQIERLVRGEIDSYRIEKRILRADGTVRRVLLARSLVRDADGDPRYFVAQAVDITERWDGAPLPGSEPEVPGAVVRPQHRATGADVDDRDRRQIEEQPPGR